MYRITMERIAETVAYGSNQNDYGGLIMAKNIEPKLKRLVTI